MELVSDISDWKYFAFLDESFYESSNNVVVYIATPEFFDPNEVKNEKPETAPWALDVTQGNLKIFFRPADEWGNPDVLYMLKTDVKKIFFESVRDNVYPK